MIVLGVDPGTLVTGYGIVETHGTKVSILTCGAIRSNGMTPMPQRLNHIYKEISRLIATYRPDDCVIETAFYGRNAQSALKLGQARGVVLLAAVSRNVPTHEYSPREVKKAIVGNGQASKEQVQYMVISLLHLKEPMFTHDITDALGVAICHLHRTFSETNHRFRNWKAFAAEHPDKFTQHQRIRSK